MESKVSTGAAFNDSTRSENTVVKSSITPWVISSRITTSTYAISGALNLEMPRIILSLNSNESELQDILNEMNGFLNSRETIASIRNAKDQENVQKVQMLNQTGKNNNQSVVSLADESVDRIELSAAVDASDVAPIDQDGAVT